MLERHRSLKLDVNKLLIYIILLVPLLGCTFVRNETTGQESNVSSNFTVSRVIDGDTIELENGERVRYLGVETPEVSHPSKVPECYGVEATERNRDLVEGLVVRLLSDGEDRDSYGRLLRYVFVDGTFVNGILVWEGYAYSRSYGEHGRLYQTLVQLEASARDNKRGLWDICQ